MEKCQEHSGMIKDVETLGKWKDDMTAPDGTIEHLWSAISKKASTGFMITVLVLLISLMATLFGLLYSSNEKIIDQFGVFQADIAVIKEKLK